MVRVPYSISICNQLEAIASQAKILRAYPPSRYDPEKILEWKITGVCPARHALAKVKVEKFAGGGFAGQVYRVRLLEITPESDPLPGLDPGQVYAAKIMIPVSGFSRFFRNLVYWLGFQTFFSSQLNHAAVRTGVLWQKLIRRGAGIRFGTEKAIVDTHATFFDRGLGSYGEINEWVEGRNWKFEIDDRLFERKHKKLTPDIFNQTSLASYEYLAKRFFMAEIVRLFHDMGAHELARQYEWGTLKSQPNALKRSDSNHGQAGGLTGIDFRAGLALLPFLPMSPADIKLIFRGLKRGRLVQFDRGEFSALDRYVQNHPEEFSDMLEALEELKEADSAYRDSLPDITCHHVRLLLKRDLRKSIIQGMVEGWQAQGLLDGRKARKLTESRFAFTLYYLVGAIPFLGRFVRKLFGSSLYARHVRNIFTSKEYFRGTLKAKQAMTLSTWHRSGRAGPERTMHLLKRPVRFWLQRFSLGWLPASWHRFLAEPRYAWGRIKNAVSYPIKFYFDGEFRETWLLEQITEGEKEGMLTREEAENLSGKIQDPFVQKYLKCIAVHLCTLPVTQVVAVLIALYAMMRFGKTWAESLLYAGIVLAFFQATPVSPGSLVRGFYVLYLMIRERNIRDYWIAALISFWHYVGYLGFPIQMVAKFPSLSRLMAGRWATQMVGFIPVFGERGALLEHWVFDFFFNLPVTLRRRWGRR